MSAWKSLPPDLREEALDVLGESYLAANNVILDHEAVAVDMRLTAEERERAQVLLRDSRLRMFALSSAIDALTEACR